MSKPLLLTEEELEQLARCLNTPKALLKNDCPREGVPEILQFSFIGLMFERLRAAGNIGVELTLEGAGQRVNLPGPYTSMAYSPDRAPLIDTVLTNRGPAAAVAIAIIQGTQAY